MVFLEIMRTSFAPPTAWLEKGSRERYGRTSGHPGIPALAAVLLLLAGSSAATQNGSPDRVVGKNIPYAVRPGDSLTLIGARFGVDAGRLARSNGLTPAARLAIGRTLQVDNRHLVPEVVGEGIVINVPQRLLFFFREGKLAAWYPVALGRRDWQTPTGLFEVASKRRQPTWHVPPSIQREMRQEGKPVRTEVAPGPDNPLGDYWIGLSGSSCGIHGTNAPSSIYSFRTHGCIRLHPEDAADLFSRVSIGVSVEIVYEPVLAARLADGTVFLEVNPDVYGRTGNLRAAFDALAARLGILEFIDPARVDAAVAAREGLAVRIDRLP
jgi:L,D-transpeptidase ErfK/SrfK